jgi:hypothetical protein
VPTGADATCGNTNSLWTTDVLPIISWIKEACPTCYSFPYDDPTSTFTCSNTDENGFNNFDYEGIFTLFIYLCIFCSVNIYIYIYESTMRVSLLCLFICLYFARLMFIYIFLYE